MHYFAETSLLCFFSVVSLQAYAHPARLLQFGDPFRKIGLVKPSKTSIQCCNSIFVRTKPLPRKLCPYIGSCSLEINVVRFSNSSASPKRSRFGSLEPVHQLEKATGRKNMLCKRRTKAYFTGLDRHYIRKESTNWSGIERSVYKL